LTVEKYTDLCRASNSSIVDFCHELLRYFPDTGKYEDMDCLDAFFLLLAVRVHYIGSTISFQLDKDEQLTIDIRKWFDSSSENIFNPDTFPRTTTLTDGAIRITIGVPRVKDVYHFNIWMMENSHIEDTDFEHRINEDFLSTMLYIRKVEIGSQSFVDRDDIRIYLENIPNTLYNEIRSNIVDLSDALSVLLYKLPDSDGNQTPMILNPLNAIEVSRTMFSENPMDVTRMAYYLSKHVSLDPFTLEPCQLEEMLQQLYADKKAESRSSNEMSIEE
jgi:hypothetical protein